MSEIVKRSIVIAGHKTSVSLEEPFWSTLKEIARTRRATLSELVHFIDDTYNGGGEQRKGLITPVPSVHLDLTTNIEPGS